LEKKLIDQYKDSLKKVNSEIEKIKNRIEELKTMNRTWKVEYEIIDLRKKKSDLGYFASNLKYAIQWMTDAREPKAYYAGIDNIKASKAYDFNLGE
jgi:predicted  nucleic acid-binding Zn-ribbon protein